VPVIVTPVAFVAVTVRTEEPPAVIEDGFAVIVTVGDGVVAAATVTVTVAVAVPPVPVAVAVYVVVAAGFTVSVPEVLGIE
jgi:hypothetical protein